MGQITKTKMKRFKKIKKRKKKRKKLTRINVIARPLPPRTQIESDILRMKEDKEKERRKSLNVSVEESKESGSKMQQASKVEEVKSSEEKKSTISKTDTTGDENDKEVKEEDSVKAE